jgi:hypothetical protein
VSITVLYFGFVNDDNKQTSIPSCVVEEEELKRHQ